MGGRGSHGGGGGGGGGGTPKLQTLTGSEKQVSWANDIRQGAFDQLNAMDKQFDRKVQEEKKFTKQTGQTYSAQSSAENLLGYNKSDVQAGREAITKFVNDPRAKNASVIIDKRRDFSPESILRMVMQHADQRKRKK